MLIRFIIDKLDSDSGRRQGLFQAVVTLEETAQLSNHDLEKIAQIRKWFVANLQKPDRLSLSTRPNSKEQALSWFKDTATEHIAKMREFSEILERHDVPVLQIKTKRPGFVVYEDEYQVCAYPFADTQT